MSFYQKASAWLKEKLDLGWTETKQVVSTYKKQAITAAIALGLTIGGVAVGHTYYQAHTYTVYHVYWHDQEVGVVNNPELITSWIDEKVTEESSKFSYVHMEANEFLRFEPEEGYKVFYDNEVALTSFQQEFSLMASATKVVIDGEFIGYATDDGSLEQVLNEIKSEYVPEKDRVALLESKQAPEKSKNTVRIASLEDEGTLENAQASLVSMEQSVEELPLDTPKMTEASIKQDIQTEYTSVHPSQVLSPEELRERLTQSRVQEKIYEVQSGDVLGSIAQKNGLKLQELMALNPTLKETDLLQIGQPLVVEGMEPYITVTTVEKLKRAEEIPYEVETKTDANMFRGDSRIEREGKNGTKHVEYQIVKENGIEVGKTVVHEQILAEPTNKVIVRGDKVKPSRGSGQFAWPAVGGKISSGFGQRWGRLHAGIDISGVRDRTIKAADNGKVTFAGRNSGYGNYVIIDHDNGYQTLYGHLSSISVSKGQVVSKGEKIGVMGSTGNSTGVHLHFEIMKNGQKINPINLVSR